jgi:hypothetical protein
MLCLLSVVTAQIHGRHSGLGSDAVGGSKVPNASETSETSAICDVFYKQAMQLTPCQKSLTQCQEKLHECENPVTNVTDRRAGSFVSGLNKDLTIQCFVWYCSSFIFAGACVGFQLYRQWATFAHDTYGSDKHRWFMGKLIACLLSILSGQQRKERLELGRRFSVEEKAQSERLSELYGDVTPVDAQTKQWIISRRILFYQILFDLCGRVFLSNVVWSVQVHLFIDLDLIWNDIAVLILFSLHMYLFVQGLLCMILCDRQFVAKMPLFSKAFQQRKRHVSGDDYCFIFPPFLLLCLTSINLKEAIMTM